MAGKPADIFIGMACEVYSREFHVWRRKLMGKGENHVRRDPVTRKDLERYAEAER
ncbi:hypothetical protein [Solilutibacter pythonis]|uniref:hypothetical protein n=1 Tax=Solilutibacter pythonis TaxID=2483112 RepID=UPI001314DE08|nr:hypothetical protein [Lysobacter pythonis]